MRYDDHGQPIPRLHPQARREVRPLTARAMTTREQDNAIERIALAAGRVRVEQLAGGNVSITIVIDPDGIAVDTSEGITECHSPAPSISSRV